MISIPLSDVARAVDAETSHRGDPTVRTADATSLRVQRISTDSRDVRPGDLFFAIRGERYDGHAFVTRAVEAGAVACVCDRRGCERAREDSRTSDYERARRDSRTSDSCTICLVVNDTVEALGRLAAYYRSEVMDRATRVVGVTGTNGKTTTKCMIDHILRSSMPGRGSPRSFNNQIGVPLTLLSAEAGDRYLIVEIGTNAPGEVAQLAGMASPDVGVITSIGEGHLEGLGGIDGVAAEKASLLRHVRADGIAVVNVDRPELSPHAGLGGDATVARFALAARMRFVSVGFSPRADLRVANVEGDARGTRFDLVEGEARFSAELRLPGLHHATNAAAAFAVARWFGLEPDGIVERLRTFEAAEGRTRVFDVGGVTLVDDTYNANAASMLAAIETLRQTFGGRRALVHGDMLELGEHAAGLHERTLRAALDAGIEIVVTVGPLSAEASRAVRSDGDAARVIVCDEAANVGDALWSMLHPGDRVWVKGSRAMGLEKAVSDLRASLAGSAVV